MEVLKKFYRWKWFKGFYERLQIINWAIEFNIPPPFPLGWGLTPISYPWRLNKIAFTHKTSIKYAPEEYGNNYIGVPLENFMQIKATPTKKIYCLTLPLKKSSVVITCPWWIPRFLNWRYRYFIHMGWVRQGSYFPHSHSLKWNPNDVLTTCKVIIKGQRFCFWSCAWRQN